MSGFPAALCLAWMEFSQSWVGLGLRESPVWGRAVFTKLMQTQVWCLPAPSVCMWGGLNTGTMVALTLKPYNSISHMSLEPFELLSLCWSLGWVPVIEQDCVRGLLKRMPGIRTALCFAYGIPCLFSQPAIVGTPLPGTGWRNSVWGWDPCFSAGTSSTEISLLILNHYIWM